MSGAIPPLPNTPSWRGAQLKHGDNLRQLKISNPTCVTPHSLPTDVVTKPTANSADTSDIYEITTCLDIFCIYGERENSLSPMAQRSKLQART
jgi:hypothetical protein